MGFFSWLRSLGGAERNKPREGEAQAAKKAPSPPTTTPPTAPAAPTVSPAARRLSYRGASIQGAGRRRSQEDYFAFVNLFDEKMILERGLLAAVADGIGGMQGGRLAAETAINTLRDAFRQFGLSGDIPEQLCGAARSASAAVYEELRDEGGCTLAVCMIYGEKLYMLSIGDSFIYLRRNGSLYRLNRDQNILHARYLEALRSGTTDRSLAEGDERKAELSQFIGMESLDDIDYFRRPLPLLDGDVLIVCTNGAGGVLSKEEIFAALGKSSPGDMCSAVERGILEKELSEQDNYTALVIKCSY
jgi:protein phosphatase